MASALCAFATSPGELIAFRALMGIGGASVMPISLSIITVIFPPQERGKAIGVWAAAVGGAVALGPVLGGLLLEHPNWFQWLTGNDWGSVFFINVPIVILGGIGIFMLVPETKNPRPGKLDPIGLVLSVVGLFAVVYGIQNASTVGWAAPSTWGFIVLGLIVLLAFGMYELKSTHPSIDLSLFRIRSFSIPLTGVSLAFAAMQGTLLFLTFYYQIVRGWSPLQAGLLVLPFAVGQLLGAPRSAKMVHRFGARKVIPGGLVFALVGMLCFAFVSPDAPVWFLIVVGVIFGFGLGNTIAPSTTRMTLATPPERSGSGSAVQNTVRQVGAVFGVAILSSVVGTVYSNNMSPLLAGQGPAARGTRGRDRLHRRHQRGRRPAGSDRHGTGAVDRAAAAGGQRFVHAGAAHRGLRFRRTAGHRDRGRAGLAAGQGRSRRVGGIASRRGLVGRGRRRRGPGALRRRGRQRPRAHRGLAAGALPTGGTRSRGRPAHARHGAPVRTYEDAPVQAAARTSGGAGRRPGRARHRSTRGRQPARWRDADAANGGVPTAVRQRHAANGAPPTAALRTARPPTAPAANGTSRRQPG